VDRVGLLHHGVSIHYGLDYRVLGYTTSLVAWTLVTKPCTSGPTFLTGGGGCGLGGASPTSPPARIEHAIPLQLNLSRLSLKSHQIPW
jgi:hypothetical protein